MNDLVKCTNCSRLPQPKEEFIGSKNQTCKLCKKCRTKYQRQGGKPETKERAEKWREDNREELRIKGRKAVDDWMQREKEKDLVGYNARIQATRKKCATAKVNQMKNNAASRNLVWELSDAEALEMVKSPCVYCNFIDLGTTVNGIDRLDSFKNYTNVNCVPCCSHCNMMKGCYDPTTFIERCRKIASCQMDFSNVPKCDEIKTKSRKKIASNRSDPETARDP
jgi:hypothetical protein